MGERMSEDKFLKLIKDVQKDFANRAEVHRIKSIFWLVLAIVSFGMMVAVVYF
jgi:hypothetical protein